MKKFVLLFSVFIIILIAVLGFLIFRIKSAYSIQKQTRFLMDTLCSIQIPGGKEVIPIIDQALDRMEEIDKKFNALMPGSPLYDFNHKNIPVTDKEIIDLTQIALEISKESNGLFDITIYPLVELWGFYSNSPHLPKKKDIDQALQKIGYKYLVIKDGKLVKLRNYIKIDLGSIAAGYAASEAMKVLQQAGIKSALIDGGGEIYVIGKLRGKPWKIGIRNPRGEGVIGVLELSDMAAATSGDYERFFEKDGVRYHHIIDPRTGYPAKGLTSVTIVTPANALADGWTTAVFVMGNEKGMEFIEEKPNSEAIIVTADGEALYSSGLKENLKIIKE